MRRVVFAAVSPIEILDLTGPFEIFARAGGYQVELVAADEKGHVGSSCGLKLSAAPSYKASKAKSTRCWSPVAMAPSSYSATARFWIGLVDEQAGPPHRLDLHRGVPASRGGNPRRPPAQRRIGIGAAA
jgi:hypothetical protein